MPDREKLTLPLETVPDSDETIVLANDNFTRRAALSGIVGVAVGAATSSLADLLVPANSVGRTAGDHAYEVADPDTPAFNETTAPNGYHLLTAAGVKLKLKVSGFVTPEMLGGNLHMAAAYAAVFRVILKTGATEYEITTAFQPHDITWISHNTRLKQMTKSGISCLKPGDNVRLVGRVILWLEDASNGSANRAHVLCGDYATGKGIENFHFDEIVLEGGHTNINGFSVAGNSHNIRGRRIDAGTSTRIGRVFMAHWGNFNDHHNDSGRYHHAVGGSATTHPHDIVVDEVVGNLELSTGDFCALWAISAGYDIHVRKVSGRCVNNGTGPGNLVLLTAGDLGFAYASPGELAAGMRDLGIGTVSGYSSHSAVNRIGRALYHSADTTPQPAENYFTKIQEKVELVDAKGAGTNTYCAVDGHNGRGSSRYGRIRSYNFRSAAVFSNYTRDVTVGVIEAFDSHNQAVQLVGAGAAERDWPTNIDIREIRVHGTGLSENSASQSTASNINKIIDLSIGAIIIFRLNEMGPFAATALHIGADVRQIVVEKVIVNWAGRGPTTTITNIAPEGRSVQIGKVYAPPIPNL